MRRLVLDPDKRDALVGDEMDLDMTFTPGAAAMICKQLTEKDVMGLPVSILGGEYHWGVGEYSTEQISPDCK